MKNICIRCSKKQITIVTTLHCLIAVLENDSMRDAITFYFKSLLTTLKNNSCIIIYIMNMARLSNKSFQLLLCIINIKRIKELGQETILPIFCNKWE